MHDQLQETLNLLRGGAQNIDPNLAVTHLRAWQAALKDVPEASLLSAELAKVAEHLQSGHYTEALALLTGMAADVEYLIPLAPPEDQEGLKILAEQLHLIDGGPDAGSG
ncbi:hypothetical protein [Deinococcus maricopensis]|uniref:Uncharacterized protein n=1 Tax=Deinococcus maricopensis (strain DSM 21211 / LMG 22137 / NRRL B-23946 / LB-34) TaxID=709986 RepID=E8U9M9_DEIML|nr:hypothetical protein [Deinococcus maricopensis]ADV67768.1 hypothetical protein Deima_2126 [Deinococcus maricopensis DSM 21211]